MSLRISPLNIVSSILIVGSAYLLLFPGETNLTFPSMLSMLILVSICFIADLIFRRLIVDLKRIWLFELLFLIFVGSLIFILKN
jgi:hypothetical protein